MTRLKALLYIIAISQLALGALTLVVPAAFFGWMGLSAPATDNNYMLGMLSARFLVFGLMLIWQARRVTPDLFIIRAMVLIQVIDFAVGAFYLATGVITLATAGFPMFNAALFAGLLVWFSSALTGSKITLPSR